jgi:hypothetical protein
MRRAAALAVGLTFALVAVGSAWADKPTRAPIGPANGILEGVCSFPVEATELQNSQVITTFSDGRTIITGGFKLRLTNLITGTSRDFNAPGKITLIPNADGTLTTIGTGRTLFFFFPGNLGPGEPGAFWYSSGRIVEVTTPDYSEFFSVRHDGGTQENLCETLA